MTAMKRFIIFLISLYIATTISAQKYISFDREIFIPENKFSLNEWLMRDTKSSNDALKISSSISRISKLSGMEHSTYQLTYGSIPLDFSSVNIHKKDGIVVSVNGNLSITDNIDTIPKISPQEALSIAIEHMQAKSYSWQVKPPFWEDQEDTKYLLQEPIPQLVICPNFKNATKTPTLAYKIELFSMEPFMHQYVYINANNGEIIHIHPLLRNINGTAETR